MNARPTLEVHATFEPLAEAWAELEATANASVYQTARWLKPWTETIGQANRIQPRLVLARSPDGAATAIFPLGLSVAGGLRILGFLGGKDSNANMPLLRPGVSFTRGFLLAALRHAAAMEGGTADAIILSSQPLDWRGDANPMRLLPQAPSASYLHSARLGPDAATFLASRLSSDARKKMRSKLRKLEALGPVTHMRADNERDARRILQAMFTQKQERLAQMGVAGNFDNPLSRAYFDRACLDGLEAGAPALELHALSAGDRIVATYGGGVHRGRFHAMINSFDMSPNVAKSSPGELIVWRMIESFHARGLEEFDLGIGEDRYKDFWCDQSQPLFDTMLGLTASGRAFCFAEGVRRRAKRIIKQSEFLWPLARRVRSLLGARR